MRFDRNTEQFTDLIRKVNVTLLPVSYLADEMLKCHNVRSQKKKNTWRFHLTLFAERSKWLSEESLSSQILTSREWYMNQSLLKQNLWMSTATADLRMWVCFSARRKSFLILNCDSDCTISTPHRWGESQTPAYRKLFWSVSSLPNCSFLLIVEGEAVKIDETEDRPALFCLWLWNTSTFSLIVHSLFTLQDPLWLFYF